MQKEKYIKAPQIVNFRLILYLGLILSETQILVNLKNYNYNNDFPFFIISFLFLTTLYLIYVFLFYAFASPKNGLPLQFYQHIVLPVSVALITFLSKNSGMVLVKTVAVMLLVTQSLLVGLKIVYFGSVVVEVAHISIINKIARIIKLNVMAMLPFMVEQDLTISIVLALCQLIAISTFFFKFTYQGLKYEYILLVGVFFGVVSAVENVFDSFFALPYLFIAEITSLYFYLTPDNYLRSLLELKYINNFPAAADSKSHDDLLAYFLFLSECLYEQKRTMLLSHFATNEGIIQVNSQIHRLRNRGEDGPAYDSNRLIKSHLNLANNEISTDLLDIYLARFRHTTSYPAFEFLVARAVELGGRFISRAMIIYYRHMENGEIKRAVLEQCKYELLYGRIQAHIERKEEDREEIKCIEFSNNLRELSLEVENCIANELKLVEHLGDSEKKEAGTDERLLLRHKNKARIRERIGECFDRKIYFISNEFKFIYLLYEITIEKRYLSLREQLKKHFIASEVQALRFQNTLKNVAVVSVTGDIINSNENFKNHFGLTLNSFGRNNISEFIPSEKARARHNQLMNDFAEFKLEVESMHMQLTCMLAIDRQINSLRLRNIENYFITVRIYYENTEGFSYICSLTHNPNSNLVFLRKDCDALVDKGLEVSVLRHFNVKQLGDTMELCQIQENVENNENTEKEMQVAGEEGKEEGERVREGEGQGQGLLSEKILAIEEKISSDSQVRRYSMGSIAELLIIVVLILFLMGVFLGISETVDQLTFVSQVKVVPVQIAELVNNRLSMGRLILSLNAQTPFFPDIICSSQAIPSLSAFIKASVNTDLILGNDAFLRLTTLPNDYGILDQNIITPFFNSTPYFFNSRVKITFQKKIQLMKMYTFNWLSTLTTTSFNKYFYSTALPNNLIKTTQTLNQSQSELMKIDQAAFTTDLLSTITLLQLLTPLAISLFAVLVILLRLRDSSGIVGYLSTIENMRKEALGDRVRQLKSAVNEVHKMRSKYVDNIEFSHEFTVSLRCEGKTTENIPLEEFTQWHLTNKDNYEMDESEMGFEHEADRLLMYEDDQRQNSLRARTLRLILYNKFYILLTLALLCGAAFLSGQIFSTQANRINTVVLTDNVRAEFNRIQAKVINIVTYNWLKVYSLQTNMSMTAGNAMFTDAISYLNSSSYKDLISSAYDKQFSDTVLYGNVCPYFASPTDCRAYRNGVFTSGFSMLLPFLIKEQLEIDSISSDPRYYLSNLCDKTALLYNGIIPMTTLIPQKGSAYMLGQASNNTLTSSLGLLAIFTSFFLITLITQYQRYWRERIIREEALSLDTVDKLYGIPQFKPYFNQIYYS